MNEIRDLYEENCFLGYRKITVLLRRKGLNVNGKKVLRLMRKMGIQGIYPKKKTSQKNEEDETYPYLLKDNPPKKPNDCWSVDITYIRVLKFAQNFSIGLRSVE